MASVLKFKVGDIIRVIVDVSTHSTHIPMGTIGTILGGFIDFNDFIWYTLAEFPSVELKEPELELAKITLEVVPIKEQISDEVLSSNPDLDKRVSENRDNLLRDIFS